MSKAATRAKVGFNLCCPFCGAYEENTLSLDLTDLGRIICDSCQECYSPESALAKAEANLSAWAKVVRMVEIGRGLADESGDQTL